MRGEFKKMWKGGVKEKYAKKGKKEREKEELGSRKNKDEGCIGEIKREEKDGGVTEIKEGWRT